MRRRLKRNRQLNMATIDIGAHDFNSVLDQLVRIGRLKPQLQFAASNAGKIKQIVDQSRLQFDIAADHAQSLLQLRIEAGLIQYSIRPKQNWIERRAQFVTESGEKPIFGRAGRFGIFFGLFQFFLDPSTLNKKPDLTAKGGDQLEEIVVRLGKIATKQLNDAVDGASGKKWKGETTAQSRLFCRGRARKIFVYRYIVNPSRLIRFPNPAGQAFAHSELNCLGKLSELLQIVRACFPKSTTAQSADRLVINPEGAEHPIADRSDRLQNRRAGFCKGP